ncbi:MAG: siderophore-interacting protein [Pseudomonadota bacterium]
MAQAFYDLTVTATRRISPSLHQVTIGGEQLDRFPEGQDGGYFKLILEPATETRKALMRTYTIRAQRPRELDVQFALHGGNTAGPATAWALAAQPGDPITIRGPGPAKPSPADFDFYMIAGDMSALPAISANLSRMSADAKGVAVLEIQDEADAQELAAPRGIELRWLINPAPGEHPDLLVDALRAVKRPAGSLSGWAACEFIGMQRLRAFLRDELAIPASALYTSSYWKHGLNETEHKLVKREDAEAQPV